MVSKTLHRRQQILSGNTYKIVLTLALPVAINNLIIALYNLIDAAIISSRGTLSLSSITFVDPIVSFFYAFSLAITVASSSLIARSIGAGDLEKAKKSMIQTIIILGGIGLIIAAIGYIFASDILRLLGATDNIRRLATDYFKIQMVAIPIKFIGDIYLGSERAQGNNVKAMWINVFSILMKVILSYYFIIVKDYGLIALAYSTLISISILASFGIIDIFIRKGQFKIKLNELKVDSKILYPLLFLSIPLIIEKTSLSFSHIIVSKQTVQFTETVLAAYGLTNKINSVMFSTATGFGVALVSLISQNLGNKNPLRAKETIKKTTIFSLLISIVFFISVMTLRKYYLPIFTRNDQELYRHTVNAMNVYSVSLIPWAIFQIIIGVFQGSGYTGYSLLITFCRMYAFRVPVIYLLIRFTNLAEYSIWYGMLFANSLTCVLAIILYFVVKWDKPPRIVREKTLKRV